MSPVKAEIAQIELQDTRRQIHAASRLTDAKECFEPEPTPEAVPRIVKKESIVLSADALFAFGKADVKGISAQGRDSLDELIGRLQKEYGSDDNALIQITGHADPLGNPAANKRLSEARALAIRSYFIQGGMSAKRITGEGVGDTQPVIATCGKAANPESIECNKPNRRVVVNLVRKGLKIAPTPGMTASVEIRTGQKTVLEYLFRPLQNVSQALRER